jgi:ubiquinone biosynthesis monooxygenase Coq7
MSLDAFVTVADRALRTLTARPEAGVAADAAGTADDSGRSRDLAGMMRVDHSGEVCAQALYLAQAMFARGSEVRNMMLQSAAEEGEHLDLTLKRLGEIGARPSHLNLVWFAGSFALGSIAALAGDRASLGFLAETERQVAEHLEGHLRRISSGDQVSRRVLRRMRDDETGHAAAAESGGGSELPLPLRGLMRASAKVMTTLAAKI